MKTLFKQTRFREFAYQAIFFSILFLTYAMDKHDAQLHLYDTAFFGFYIVISLFISYVLIPKFFYSKKLLAFWSSIVLIMLLVYFVEEYILEPWLVGGNRGEHVSHLGYTLISIFPYIFMMVSFKLAWDTIQKQQELEHLQLTVKESELRFLKSQINPHFLFNNLNNLYAYAIENSDKTPTIILELSSVLRYVLYDSAEDYVPLNKEIEHLEHFTALNELQIENRGSVTFTSTLANERYVIAPLLLTMFVENAFKHSTASQSEAITIAIDINVSEEGVLVFDCKNSFLDTSNNDNLSKGIGLENVKKRLNFLYPNLYELHIDTSDQVYHVHLSLQLSS